MAVNVMASHGHKGVEKKVEVKKEVAAQKTVSVSHGGKSGSVSVTHSHPQVSFVKSVSVSHGRRLQGKGHGITITKSAPVVNVVHTAPKAVVVTKTVAAAPAPVVAASGHGKGKSFSIVHGL